LPALNTERIHEMPGQIASSEASVSNHSGKKLEFLLAF